MPDTKWEQGRGPEREGLDVGPGLTGRAGALNRSSRWWNSPSPKRTTEMEPQI